MAVVMLGFVSLVSAQKPFAGTIKMHSHIEGTEDPNLLSQGENDYSIQIFGNYTKTVVSQEGFGFTTITNGDAKTAVYIIEIMGMGKYYYEVPTEKIQEQTIIFVKVNKRTRVNASIAVFHKITIAVFILPLGINSQSQTVKQLFRSVNRDTAAILTMSKRIKFCAKR